MKKIFAILMAMIMMLSVAAMAAQITITGAVEGQTYTAYKLFSATDSGDSISYTCTEAVYNVLKDMNTGLTFNLIAGSNPATYNVVNEKTGEVSNFDGDDAADLAAALNNLTDKTALGTGIEDTNGTISGLDAGYYFIDSSMGALCMLQTSSADATINEKNEEPTLEKSADDNVTTANVGDEIDYTIVVTAGGAADTTYVVHDKMTNLEYVADSIEIKVGDTPVAAENYTIAYNTADGCALEITFNQAYTASLTKDTQIVITYKAKLLASAINEGANNEAKLTYGGSETVTDNDNNITTYDFQIKKVNDKGEALTDAIFTLAQGNKQFVFTVVNGVYTVCPAGTEGAVNTINAGAVTIQGLAEGVYTLTETEAPTGYNKLTAPITVTIGANGAITLEGASLEEENSDVIKVVNAQGTALPSTGGIGTTIFYVVGGLLMAAAVVLLVTNKKMSAAK